LGHGSVDGEFFDPHIFCMENGNRTSRQRIRREIPLFPLRSTSIAAAGYARKWRILRLRYSGGRTYDYLGVSQEVFRAFLAAPSKGQFVNWRIKPHYPYACVH
jgi:hypothetical protein